MTMTADNATKGRVNELLLGYYINGKEWFDAEAKQEFNNKKGILDPDTLSNETIKSKEMAEKFLEHAAREGYHGVQQVFWIGGGGQSARKLKTTIDPTGNLKFDIDPIKNPADLMIEFQTGVKGRFEKWLGLSAKTSEIKSGKIGFKNLGLGTMDKLLGLHLSDDFKKAMEKFAKQYGLDMIADKRKIQIRKSKKLVEEADKAGDKLLEQFRDEIWKKLTKLNFDQAHEHILENWMNSGNLFPPYLKVTGGGVKPPFNIKVENPKQNPKLDAINKNSIKFIKTGIQSIQVIAGNERIFNIRVKFDSQKMAGSIKLNADPA